MYYSALQAFTALAGCILWLFMALCVVVRDCVVHNCELLTCKAKLLATIGTAGESRGEATATPGEGCSGRGSPLCYISLKILDKKSYYIIHIDRLDLYPKLDFI